MLKMAQTVLLFPLFLVTACGANDVALHPEVFDFIQLLVRTEAPTLAEYERFGGDCGGESELTFEIEECRSRGWGINSVSCIDFTRQQCQAADQVNSLKLSWLRERFFTVGKDFRVISVRMGSVGFEHELIEVEIGENGFLLVHNLDPRLPTGTLVGVSRVNGRTISEYLESQ